MKNTFFYSFLLLFVFTSCQKKVDIISQVIGSKSSTSDPGFVKYTIKKGEQFCDMNSMTKVEYDEQRFKVKFDSSAIYKSLTPSNQYDINKLFGFSDNNAYHHQFSARFGWNWNKNVLTLFAYTYNNSVRESKSLGSINIGQEVDCSIKVSGDKYIFTVNGKVETMTRASATAKAIGYKLFPYFGGDELAPHNVSIWIKEIQPVN